MEAFQTAINQLSADGVRISYVPSKGRELGAYMAQTLDEEWNRMRGMEIQSVGIASISYDEESQELINMRNKGAMMGDPSVREGYVQSSVAEGLKAAGSNSAGSMAGFMGMGFGMQAGGGFMGAASASNLQQMGMNRQQQPQGQPQGQPAGGSVAQSQGDGWFCPNCGTQNFGKFCSECGTPRPAPSSWTCSCGAVNTGKFCTECGKPRNA